MGTNTIMLGFQIRENVKKEEVIASFPDILSTVMNDVTILYPPNGVQTSAVTLYVATGNNGRSTATVCYHSNGMLAIDVHHESLNDEELVAGSEPYDLDYTWKLNREVQHRLGDMCLRSVSLPVPVRRPCSLPLNFRALGDERLVETDFTHALCDVTSPFQQITILESRLCGRTLKLDNDIMISESDKVYTTTLLGLDRGNNFSGVTVLILGGGDGDLLNTLTSLPEPPKHVIMAEIDEDVMKLCAQHMTSVCGNVFDNHKTDRYTILVRDCVEVLKESVEKGDKFDYIVNDLTEFPVSKEKYGFRYDFETSNIILELSVRCLEKGGKYLARGNTLSSVDYRQRVEKEMAKLGLAFRRFDRMVLSFMEMYCLYEAWIPS